MNVRVGMCGNGADDKIDLIAMHGKRPSPSVSLSRNE